MTATKDKQIRAWAAAAVIAMISFVICFSEKGLVGHAEHKSALALDRAVSERFENAGMEGQPSGPVASDGSKLPWEPYSTKTLNQLLQDGETVLVDFTADWCLTCKANESAAIETSEFAAALRRGEFVALRADKTEPNPEADQLLRQLGNSAASIPFYAFFSRENPRVPTLLDGVYASPQPFVAAIDASPRKTASNVGMMGRLDSHLTR